MLLATVTGEVLPVWASWLLLHLLYILPSFCIFHVNLDDVYCLILLILFCLQLIKQIFIKNVSYPPWSFLQAMTMWYVEQDQRVVFWQTVSQQILTTKLFFWRQVLKIGHGKSTCLLHLFIIFVTKNITGIMKQNHKSLWTTGNKMMFMYSTY